MEITTLPPELMERIKQVDFTPTPEELKIIIEIRNNPDAEFIHRKAVAKYLYESAENKARKLRELADRYRIQYLELEHASAVKRNEDNLIEAVKEVPQDVLALALKKLMEKKGLI